MSAPAGPAFSPLYRQVKALLTDALHDGRWKPGEVLPSEQELAGRYRVSQGTVRKAIDELAAENLVVRRQGKGTFVASHAEERAQFRFLRLAPDDGVVVPAERRFIGCERRRAEPDVARALALKTGEAVLRIERVLSFRGSPVVLDEIWLPGHLFKGMTEERLAAYRGPMYQLFEAEFGVHMVRADEKIRAVAADPPAAALLAVGEGAPLLSVERLSYTYGDRPVELRRGRYRTDAFHYRNDLQ